MMHLPEKALLRVDEVSKYYSVSAQSVYKWIRLGKLKSVKVGKAVRILREDALGLARVIPLQR